VHCSYFRVGGVSVEVSGGRCADTALAYSLHPFRAEPEIPDIQVQIERTSGLFRQPDLPLFDSGAVWKLYQRDEDFQFDFSAPTMGANPYKRLIVDPEFRSAQLLVDERHFTARPESAAPLDYPLDELLIMHRLTQEKAIELHGCGIVRADGIGNLFVGHSGAGKSTTTRLWITHDDAEILSDDRIIVRREPCNDSSRMRMYGTPWHGEAMYASPGSAPLARIFVLEHGHGNVLTRLSPSQAVAELFARSFVPFHRHEYVDSALQFLQEVVDAIPVYRYAFEPDQRAVDKILNLHD
jgi:hypothetical protein